MSEQADEIERVLTALADPTRRRILDTVAIRGEATATMLAAELPVSRQAVAKHLALLDRAGLITSYRDGREKRYVVRAAPLAATAQWITDLAAAWDARLARIKRIAEAMDAGSGDET